MFEAMQDLRFVLRSFFRKRAFFALAVATLALGIGANTAIFSVVQAVLLQPLPYPDEERLMWIWGHNQLNPRASISPPDFADYSKAQESFEAFAAFVGYSQVIGTELGTRKVTGALVSRDFFSVLGFPATVGRTLQAEDFEEASERVIVLSQGLFQDSFGSDPARLGSPIRVGTEIFTLVGVMPEDFGLLPATFQLSDRARFWVPFDPEIPEFSVRRFHFLSGLGKLKPGITPRQARSDLAGIAAQLEEQYPDTNTGWGLSLAPLREELTGDVRNSLWILLGAVVLVLLIACSNVANLLLARSYSRTGELALRAALGANRPRILRLLFAEGLFLSLTSGLLGILLAQWVLALLVQLSPAGIPRLQESGLNWQVLLFSTGLSLTTALVFALIPAGRAFGLDLGRHLKQRETLSVEHSGRFPAGLVVAEIAVATVLLLGTGLLLKSYLQLTRVDPGFEPDSVVTTRIALSASRLREASSIHQFFRDLTREVRLLSGVREVGLVDRVPMLHLGNDTAFVIEGESLENRDDRKGAYIRAADGGYFRAMGIPLLKGRLFDERDRSSGSPALIVSRSFAEEIWPEEDPIGRYVTLDLGDPVAFQVVGVVGSVRQSRLETSPWRTMYLSIEQRQELIEEFSLVIEGGANPDLAADLQQVLNRYDPDIAVSEIQSMQAVVARTSAQNRFNLLLMLCFAGLALVLACIGIYGVVSYGVQQRTREIGIRMALGAQVRQVMQLVLRGGIRLILLGGGLGLLAGFGLARGLSGLLYEVEAHDPAVFLAGSAVLVVTAVLANYLPARRASRIDPVLALKGE